MFHKVEYRARESFEGRTNVRGRRRRENERGNARATHRGGLFSIRERKNERSVHARHAHYVNCDIIRKNDGVELRGVSHSARCSLVKNYT